MKTSFLAIALFFASASAIADSSSDAETGVVCQATAVSTQGVSFLYQLHGAGEILEDGYLKWSSGELRFDVLMKKPGALKAVFVIKDAAPVDVDGGHGHREYDIPGSALGLSLDVSSLGHSISVEHKIDVNEVIAASGTCLMVE